MSATEASFGMLFGGYRLAINDLAGSDMQSEDEPSDSITDEQPSTTDSDESEDDFDSPEMVSKHLRMLNLSDQSIQYDLQAGQLRTAPLFSMPVSKAIGSTLGTKNKDVFPQFGLFAGRSETIDSVSEEEIQSGDSSPRQSQDRRIFLNVNAPWSTFICGSQGSGKSHSLSCMLESCILPNRTLGRLPAPLTALVFHYDTFSSSFGGQICEAAYLCSSGINVRVLVSPSNLKTMKKLYGGLARNLRVPSGVTVEPLLLDPKYLNAEKLITLMAAGNNEGPMPLYMQSVLQILRELAQKSTSTQGINYPTFKNMLLSKDLTPAQKSPLQIRLDILESFIVSGSQWPIKQPNNWAPHAGSITIVDLSCPFVDADTACGLFEICLGVFLEQDSSIGRVVALDEAHKFMRESGAAMKLTESLMTVIRLQRHLACRIIIATQEPTISPRLLDLCSMTIVHRFSSPQWFQALKGHLAAASMGTLADDEDSIFTQIVRLNVGEALLFAPTAALDVEQVERSGRKIFKFSKMDVGYLHIRVRERVTVDGGKSICAIPLS